ncbi:hypothetical protein Milano_110 [Agrobacterium phage Milano]|nr:hypothetical protein Milano_110 [Agrobacterium phage Milano]
MLVGDVMTLLLTAGYGHDSPSKVWLSFRARPDYWREIFVEMAENFGCEKRFADKAASILETSCRYDCCVQRVWINNRLYNLVEAMSFAGVTVKVDPEYFPPRGYHRSVKV